ncbi:uncharacterized protein ACOB8E_008521 isoform 1-T3 [Sarcophilus harrisii]
MWPLGKSWRDRREEMFAGSLMGRDGRMIQGSVGDRGGTRAGAVQAGGWLSLRPPAPTILGCDRRSSGELPAAPREEGFAAFCFPVEVDYDSSLSCLLLFSTTIHLRGHFSLLCLLKLASFKDQLRKSSTQRSVEQQSLFQRELQVGTQSGTSKTRRFMSEVPTGETFLSCSPDSPNTSYRRLAPAPIVEQN